MNSVNLIGRLGGDPELKYTNKGTAVCTFSLAIRRDKDNTDWFNVVCFKQTAEAVSNYVAKGAQIGISGHLQVDKWVTQEGMKREAVGIVADRVTLIGSKQDGAKNENEDPWGDE